MKQFRTTFLFSLFMLISFSDFAQTFSPSFYIDLPDKKSCYIQAQKVEKGWEVNLHNFQQSAVKDTTFILPIVTTDTLLKIIYFKTTDLTKEAINKTTFTQKERSTIDQLLPVLFQSSIAERLAGQFIVSDSIIAHPDTSKNKPQYELQKIITIKSHVYNSYVLISSDNKKYEALYSLEIKLNKDGTTKSIFTPIAQPKTNVIVSDSIITLPPSEKRPQTNIDKTILTKTKIDSSYVLIMDNKDYESIYSLQTKLNKDGKIDSTYTIMTLSENSVDTFYTITKTITTYTETDSIIIIPPLLSLRVSKIQMDIKDGFIENLKVESMLNNKVLLFKNQFPIPISSKRSLDIFNRTVLYNIYEDVSYKIYLRDLLIYNYEIKSNQLDISPSDTTISYILPSDNSGIINGNKEDQDKIFEYRIYTDVVGINDANPNGLIQIEGYKKINLWGRYYRFMWSKTGIGYFQYIEPSIKVSKIENNNSYLIVNSDRTIDTSNHTVNAVNHITPLELLRYQKLAVTTNFNIFKFYNDNFKMKASIDFHGGFGQTKIRDSIYAVDTTSNTIINTQRAPKDVMANTLQLGIAAKLNFLPDARWGFDIGIRYTNILLLDATYIQTNVDTRTTFKEDKWINRAIISPEFELHKNFTNGGKFYVRYVFNAQVNKWWYNFTQFQVGYNAYVKF